MAHSRLHLEVVAAWPSAKTRINAGPTEAGLGVVDCAPDRRIQPREAVADAGAHRCEAAPVPGQDQMPGARRRLDDGHHVPVECGPSAATVTAALRVAPQEGFETLRNAAPSRDSPRAGARHPSSRPGAESRLAGLALPSSITGVGEADAPSSLTSGAGPRGPGCRPGLRRGARGRRTAAHRASRAARRSRPSLSTLSRGGPAVAVQSG